MSTIDEEEETKKRSSSTPLGEEETKKQSRPTPLLEILRETKGGQTARAIDTFQRLGVELTRFAAKQSAENVRSLVGGGGLIKGDYYIANAYLKSSLQTYSWETIAYTFESLIWMYHSPRTIDDAKRARVGQSISLSSCSLLFQRDSMGVYKQLFGKQKLSLPTPGESLMRRNVTLDALNVNLREYEQLMEAIEYPEVKERMMSFATQVALCISGPMEWWAVPSVSSNFLDLLHWHPNRYTRACRLMAVCLQLKLFDAITKTHREHMDLNFSPEERIRVAQSYSKALRPDQYIDFTYYFVLLSILNPVELGRILLEAEAKSFTSSAVTATRHCKKDK